jgi:transcriptional regulator with XRE-family HTH domain
MENKRMTLSEKLKDLRKCACMTQDDIAEVLEMNRTSFSKYENGASTPPLAVLRKLAKIYSVPLEYLIHDEQPFYVLNESTEEDVEREMSDTVSNFAQLSPEERKLIMKMRLLSDVKKKEIIHSIEDNSEE